MFNSLRRLKNIIFREERFTEGAAVLSILTFLSYITGLLRDRIFAQTFGAGREMDLYNASFIVPDLLLTILVTSAISAAFIPIFTSLYTQDKKEEANELANTVIHGAFFTVLAAGSIAAIFMPQLAKFIAPGFTGEERETLISLSRLMLISPVIMAISSTLGAMLVSFKKFIPYGLSPILYNFGIIAGTFTTPWFGIYGLVLGTLVGASLHILPRFFGIRLSHFRYSFIVKWRSKNFIKLIKLMIPKMIGHPVEQLTFLGFTRIASLLAAGSVTAVSFARNFQSVPVSLFGIAFSLAIFPVLAEAAGKSDRESFLKNFWKAFRNILLFTIPSAIGLYILSDLPIRIFLGGGRFDEESIMRTAAVLGIFAFSIPTESLKHLLARSFYALKNTIIPVSISVLGFAISVSFAWFRWREIGIVAIPYGFLLGSLTEITLLGLFLKLRVKKLKQPIPSPQS